MTSYQPEPRFSNFGADPLSHTILPQMRVDRALVHEALNLVKHHFAFLGIELDSLLLE